MAILNSNASITERRFKKISNRCRVVITKAVCFGPLSRPGTRTRGTTGGETQREHRKTVNKAYVKGGWSEKCGALEFLEVPVDWVFAKDVGTILLSNCKHCVYLQGNFHKTNTKYHNNICIITLYKCRNENMYLDLLVLPGIKTLHIHHRKLWSSMIINTKAKCSWSVQKKPCLKISLGLTCIRSWRIFHCVYLNSLYCNSALPSNPAVYTCYSLPLNLLAIPNKVSAIGWVRYVVVINVFFLKFI